MFTFTLKVIDYSVCVVLSRLPNAAIRYCSSPYCSDPKPYYLIATW